MRKILRFIAASCILITSLGANAALLKIHEAQLLKSCHVLQSSPATLAAATCATYISGFLDGALIMDTDNARALEDADRSNFMNRALKTRLGIKEGSTGYLHFCIPAEQARTEVVEQLAPYLVLSPENVDTLKASIYKGLKAEFPCGKDI